MIWGKLLGGALGFALGQGTIGTFLGLIIGVFLGHQLDKSTSRKKLKQREEILKNESQEETQDTFFSTTFSVMGYISKSDGRVSKQEIQLAEQVMKQMRLSKQQRIAAIEYFNQGKQADFDLEAVLYDFREKCEHKTALLQMFVEIQLQAVYADGSKHANESQILQQICSFLGYPEVLLAQLESMFFASNRSRQSSSANSSYTDSNTALEDAYKIIGANKTASDDEVKKAYRKLMSENHPDKLIAKGLPEEMIEIATN